MKKKPMCILLVTSLFALIFTLYYITVLRPIHNVPIAEQGEDLQLCIVTPEQSESVSLFIRDDHSYYFLPSHANDTNTFFRIGNNCQLSLDGKKIPSDTVPDGIWDDANEDHVLSFVGPTGKETFLDNVRFLRSANIPSIFMDVDSSALDDIHSDKMITTTASVRIYDADGTITCKDEHFLIKCRGNQSFGFEKKPYHLSAETEHYIPGIGNVTDFTLLNHAYDHSYARNMIVHELAEGIGMRFIPRMTFCDVYINHEYRGNYLLSQKPTVGASTVDIQDLSRLNAEVNSTDYYNNPHFGEDVGSRKGICDMKNPVDITGGYLLERNYIDKYRDKESGIITIAGNPFIIREPRYASMEEVDYIGRTMDNIESAIYSRTDTATSGQDLSELIDLKSFADKYVLEEFSLNAAQAATSAWYYKDSDQVDGKLYAGPVWDYDKAFGDAEHYEDPTFLSKSSSYYALNRATDWFAQLYRKSDFLQLVKTIYCEQFKNALNDVMENRVPYFEDLIDSSAAMDQIRWPDMHPRNYHDEIEAMRKWITARIVFLDKIWIEGKQPVTIKYIESETNKAVQWETIIKGQMFTPMSEKSSLWIDPVNGGKYENGRRYYATHDINLYSTE